MKIERSQKVGIKIIQENRKAYHEYFIEERFEAGIVLTGTEIKSVRSGGLNLKDSYCVIKHGEIVLLGAHISPYKHGTIYNVDPTRDRKLLLHKKEIRKLIGKVQLKGYTLIPIKAYLKAGLLKIEIGLAKGKELHDKRDSIKQREQKRNIERVMKNYKVR